MLVAQLAAGSLDIRAHLPAHGHMDPALFQGGHKTLQLSYVHRFSLDAHNALSFTLLLLRADSAADCWQVTGFSNGISCFVDASILGWVNYLYGDRRAANALLRKDNPEMGEDEIEASVALLKSQGIVDSGEARTLGIGAMNLERIRDFYGQMVQAGLYRASEIDLAKVATTRFVNRKVGLDVKERLVPAR